MRKDTLNEVQLYSGSELVVDIFSYAFLWDIRQLWRGNQIQQQVFASHKVVAAVGNLHQEN